MLKVESMLVFLLLSVICRVEGSGSAAAHGFPGVGGCGRLLGIGLRLRGGHIPDNIATVDVNMDVEERKKMHYELDKDPASVASRCCNRCSRLCPCRGPVLVSLSVSLSKRTTHTPMTASHSFASRKILRHLCPSSRTFNLISQFWQHCNRQACLPGQSRQRHRTCLG